MLNKIDLVDKPALLTLAQAINAKAKFDATFMLSALSGDGVADLKALARRACAGGPVALSGGPDLGCADAQRSRPRSRARSCSTGCTRNCPTRRRSRPRVWKELRGGDVRIEQTIYVERESQRKIVLGKGGATIKAIGAEARKEIAELTEQKVHLFLFVKVREGWGDDPERYRADGDRVSARSERCHRSDRSCAATTPRGAAPYPESTMSACRPPLAALPLRIAAWLARARRKPPPLQTNQAYVEE